MNTTESSGRELPQSSTQALIKSAQLWSRLARMHDLSRVASAVVVTEHQLTRLISDVNQSGSQCMLEALYHSLLDDAKESLRSGDFDSAWNSVHALEREMLPLYSNDELKARWVAASEEAKDTKVSGWRAAAASSLNQTIGDSREELLAALRETLSQIHTSAQNTYARNRLMGIQVTWSAAGVTALVLAAVLMNWLGFFNVLGPDVQQTLPLAVFSGLLGGVLSVANTVARWDADRKIPEGRASFTVTMVRPVVGAAIALPVMFFLESGLIVADARLWVVLGLCFIGGFSERWFLGIVERIEARS